MADKQLRTVHALDSESCVLIEVMMLLTSELIAVSLPGGVCVTV